MESRTATQNFAGLCVLSLESRRATEMAKLIETYGGVAIVAPSMREVPLETNTEAQDFTRRLLAGEFDMVILLTGVGTRALTRVAETVCPREEFVSALKKIPVVARGPKPVAALKELGITPAVTAPEPNTWRELLAVLDQNRSVLQLQSKRVALQEYGAPNPELIGGLAQRRANVTQVPVYEWALPVDVQPLRDAVTALVNGEVDVALFTTSIQIIHLLKIAAEMGKDKQTIAAFQKILVGSIGPVTSEELQASGIAVDMEPSHPKMGFLVNEVAQRSAELLSKKRAAADTSAAASN
ncbi:MAG: uroporphyrinogen-III synthase [Acidobacteria bacterium]|nr:uroporphyrinogen-III synthase [Acidobacteriota bacterium]